MVVSSCVGVAAQGERIQIDTMVDQLNPEDFAASNALLVQKGRSVRNQRSSVSLSVPHYYQISNYYRGIVTDDYAIDFIIGAIDSGLPVLVGMTPDDANKDTHFVTAYGYSGSTIYIHDPASGVDYTELSQYLANYSVHRLYVYTD